jgi:hypothetical protein
MATENPPDRPDPEEAVTHAEAAEQLANMVLNLLPKNMPMLGLRAACLLVGALAAHADSNPDTIEAPPPELGRTWLHAAKTTADNYYQEHMKKREDLKARGDLQ